MKHSLIHMRDQKASLIVMERYRRQQAIQTGLGTLVMVVGVGMMTLVALM